MNRPLQHLKQAAQRGPIAGPIASSAVSTSPLADGESAPRSPANDGAPRGTTTTAQQTKRPYATTADVETIASRLSHRDRAILRSTDDHQYLTTRHIEALHFDTI